MYSYLDVVGALHSLHVALELLDVVLPALESLLVVNSFAFANATRFVLEMVLEERHLPLKLLQGLWMLLGDEVSALADLLVEPVPVLLQLEP